MQRKLDLPDGMQHTKEHLELWIVEDFLDGDVLAGVAEFGAVDDSKCTFTDDFEVRIRYFFLHLRTLAGRRHHRYLFLVDIIYSIQQI